MDIYIPMSLKLGTVNILTNSSLSYQHVFVVYFLLVVVVVVLFFVAVYFFFFILFASPVYLQGYCTHSMLIRLYTHRTEKGTDMALKYTFRTVRSVTITRQDDKTFTLVLHSTIHFALYCQALLSDHLRISVL